MRLHVMKVLCAVWVVLFVSLAAVQADAGSGGPLSDAKRQYANLEFAGAHPVFAELAAQSDPEAQYYLGLMSWFGLGEEQNYDQAHDLLEKSSAQGFKPAKWGLACFYEYGLDFSLAPAEAYAKSNALSRECGVAPGTQGVVKNEYAQRFAEDSTVVMKAMAEEINAGNRLLDSDRGEGIRHLHQAEAYLVAMKKSGPTFFRPAQFMLFSLQHTYREHGIEPAFPELYQQTQRDMHTGVSRAEDQRQQLIERLKQRFGAQ